MGKPTFADIEQLFDEAIVPFYDIVRDITIPLQKRRLENDAEHSWSLAFLACALAPQIDRGLDVGKVCMFAIVHDVVEIFAGDTSVWSPSDKLASKAQRESAAVQKFIKNFSAFPWIGKTIEEYERKDSPEAKFVTALDKLLNLLIVYKDKGVHNIELHKVTKEMHERQLIPHRQKAHAHPAVIPYYEKLRTLFDSHPEYFYQGKPQ